MISIHMNASSLLAQRQLGAAHSSIATSLERLSTGFKINRASDNAANLAISKGMSSQLSGTTVAIDNALQGINLLDTADGALGNMTEKVNRIRDLCLQSMNGIYIDAERSMMQQEVDKLTAEIYREKNSTTFNNIQLFEAQSNAPPDSGGGGSPPDGATAASEIQTLNAGATDEVAATFAVRASEKPYAYEVEYIEASGQQWIDTGVIPSNTTGAKIEFQHSDVNKNMNKYIMASNGTEAQKNRWITPMISWIANDDIQYGYGPLNSEGGKFDWDNQTIYLSEFNYLNNREIKLQGNLIEKINYSFPDTANQSIHIFDAHTTSSGDFKFNGKLYSAQITEGTEIIKDFIPVLDNNGVACLYDKVNGELFYNKGAGELKAGPKIPGTETEPPAPLPEEPKPTPTPTPPPTFRPGDVMLQIGANSGAYNKMGIDLTFDMSGFTADISTDENASQTLEQMDKFKDLLVNKRSHVGAQRNRLESVINASTTRKENLASSHSTILDTDFASETAKLARQQILKQATSSLLAQANQMPNIALLLLN